MIWQRHKTLQDAYDIGKIKAHTCGPLLKFLCESCVHRMVDRIAEQEQPTPELQERYRAGFLAAYQEIKE